MKPQLKKLTFICSNCSCEVDSTPFELIGSIVKCPSCSKSWNFFMVPISKKSSWWKFIIRRVELTGEPIPTEEPIPTAEPIPKIKNIIGDESPTHNEGIFTSNIMETGVTKSVMRVVRFGNYEAMFRRAPYLDKVKFK